MLLALYSIICSVNFLVRFYLVTVDGASFRIVLRFKLIKALQPLETIPEEGALALEELIQLILLVRPLIL